MHNFKPNFFMGKTLLKISMGLAMSLAVVVSSVGATLHGHVPAAVVQLQAKGRLAAATNLNLAIGLPLRNQEALNSFLQQISDPTSPSYHHYLTPEEFTSQFGPTEQDYQKVVDFANANGLTVTKRHGNRVLLDVSGKVSDIEKAFHVTMRTYRHPREARDFFAPDVEPSLSNNVPVLHISGLDNYFQPRPALHKMPASNVKPALGSGPFGGYMGSDFRNAYVPGAPASLNGSGQTVGLLQFDSGFFQSDINTYESQAGLPNVPVQAVLLDGYSGGPGIANDEVSLDIEMTMSMAPGVSKILVFEGEITDDILNAMASNNQVKQLSASWSYPIDQTSEQIFQQFAAQGQSFFNCSQDFDAWVGQIATPCDDPHVTVVGGTTLTTTTNSAWSAETVWNWDVEFGTNFDGIGSGGGISTVYSIPSWQTNIIMTTNHGSTTMRNIPDVALTADNVYVVFGGGSLGIFGGTSAATPLWAGYMALINQQSAANGNSSVGFLNPLIYALAKGTNYNNYFHDITNGNNTWSGSRSNFFAVPGYDLCTGLGTPNGTNLITALAGAVRAPVSAPLPPYGTNLTALNGGNPNGTWSLFAQDDANLDAGIISNGWILNLTTASPVGAAADSALTMTATLGTVSVGSSNAVYVLSVTNYGPSISTNVSVSDTLPSGLTLVSTNATQGSINRSGTLLTWNVGTLISGTGAQITLTVQPNSSGTFVNTASVTTVTPDPNPDDNSASAAITAGVPTPPQLSGTLTATNHTFQFTITSAANQTNVIQASTNLINWIPIYTNVGPFTFTDPKASNYLDRFYRDLIIGP
jgi:uncharacterized repeat protein (TIGR01451 family)